MKDFRFQTEFSGRQPSFYGCRSYKVRAFKKEGTEIYQMQSRQTFAAACYLAGRFVEMAKTDGHFVRVVVFDKEETEILTLIEGE